MSGDDIIYKIIQIMPNFALAGAEILVENLTMALRNKSYKIIIISLFDEQSPITKRLESNNIHIYYLGKKEGLDLKMISRLYKIFKHEKPKVIHTHRYVMKYSIPAAVFAKIPIKLHTLHSIAEKEANKVDRVINSFFYRFCNVIPVAISPAVKQSIVNEYKLTEDQVPMIYNGIDLSKCIPKKDYLLNTDKILILHIGRFTEVKNHIGILESFKIVHDKEPNTVLQLIGAGELENKARDKVVELELEDCVEFLGLQSNVYTFLNSADIFILPSLWEGMPITLIEAMGTGLPIVATKVGGIPDMIEDNVSGILVDVNNKEISDAVLRLIKNENLRKRLGITAGEKSKNFSSEKMAKEYMDLYE